MEIREINPILFEAMNSAFDVGNVVHASLCVGHICFTRYTIGENLGTLEEFVRESNTRISKLSKGVMNRFAQPSMQFVINMRSSGRRWKDLMMLSGDIMDENEYMRKAISTKNQIWMIALWTYKSLLAFHFGDFEMAASIYDKMESVARLHRCGFAGPNYYFHGAMIFYERFRATRRGRHLRTVRKHRKNLVRFEATGSPNASHFLLFLKAEELSLKSKDVGEILAAYTTAIGAVKKAHFFHLEALASERLSNVLSQLGKYEMSDSYMDRALTICEDPWGASAKYEWLLEKRHNSRSKSRANRTSDRAMIPLDEIQF
jgi:tetratricopeptide (TPR) repeat protein